MISSIITSFLLAAAVILLRLVMKKKLNGKLLMIMWAVVFLKFALPINIPTAFSVLNLSSVSDSAERISSNDSTPIFSKEEDIPKPEQTETNDTSSPVNNDNSDSVYTEYLPPETDISEQNDNSSADWRSILNYIYIAVTVMLTGIIVLSYIICAVRFSRFEDIEEDMGAMDKIRLKKGDIGTPAVFGIIKPVILLPSETDFSDKSSLGHIILHEQTHICHHDPLWNLLTLLICAINWYDPLVWICRALFLKDTERYCDESVIVIIGDENRKEYARSLLKCAEERNRLLLLVSGFGESDIKGRIKAILSMKKVRMGTALAAALLIIASAIFFGTGRQLTADITESGFLPSGENRVYSQTITGSSGEKAEVQLLLDHSYGEDDLQDYYHFILDIASDEYTLDMPRADFFINGVSRYRFLPDEPVDNPFTGDEGYSEVRYSAEFSKESHDIEAMLYFDFESETSLDITVTYKLKKGIFTVGEYSMQVHYDPWDNDESYYASAMNSFNKSAEEFENRFEMTQTEDGYEIRNTDGAADMYLFLTDNDDSVFSVCRDTADGRVETVFEGSFDPVRTEIFVHDFNGDGINDMALEQWYTGTFILDNRMIVVDGKTLNEIPIDKNAEETLTNTIKVIQNNDSEFSVLYADSQYDFISYYQLENNALADSEGYAISRGGTKYHVENGRIYGTHSVTVRDEKVGASSEQVLCSARIDFIYSDGRFIPDNDIKLTGSTDYGERVRHINDILWAYDILGYNEPYELQLVRVRELPSENSDKLNGMYALRLAINEEFIAWCPFENYDALSLRPELIDDMFIKAGNMGGDPGLVFFRQKTDKEGIYKVSAYKVGSEGEVYPVKFRYENGSYAEHIEASENFASAEWEGYYYDSYTDERGIPINRRYPYEYKGGTMVVNVVDVGSSRVLENISLPMLNRNDEVYTNKAYANERMYYPHVQGSYYRVDWTFKSIQDILSLINTEAPPEAPGNAEYETTFYYGGEFYFFTLYDKNYLQFRTGDITEYYRLTDNEKKNYLKTIEITLGGAVDYIAKSFAKEIEMGYDRNITLMDELVCNEAYYSIDGKEYYSDPPSSWDVFKSVSVFSNVELTCVSEFTENNFQALYRLSFELQSEAPAPFKNGHNTLAMVIGEPFESGSTRIIKLTDYNDFMHHISVISGEKGPEYAVYDFLKYVNYSEYASASEITDEAMLFYLLYSNEPWLYYDSITNGFDGVTPEQLKAAAMDKFGRDIKLSESSRYYDPDSGKYYAQGMGIPEPEKYVITDTKIDGDFSYITVKKYRGICCLYCERTILFTLEMGTNGYRFVGVEDISV
ncbi:MAG: M56 family metallopeptidase [Oscillospiraceae bacterium]